MVAKQVIDPDEIARIRDLAKTELEDHILHCDPKVPYPSSEHLVNRLNDSEAVLICVYEADEPIVFIVVSALGEGEWILFCREPKDVFAGNAMQLLGLAVEESKGKYYGEVRNQALCDLFASTPWYGVDGRSVVWRG